MHGRVRAFEPAIELHKFRLIKPPSTHNLRLSRDVGGGIVISLNRRGELVR
jgi:hypothetical protein